jgi:hypothetical protein
VDVQKNRVCGWEGKVPLVSFLKGHGVDEVGTCVDYLLDEKHWQKVKGAKDDPDEESGGPFAAPEFGFEGRKEALVKKIQEAGDEWELSQLVARVWRAIVAGATPERKARYT